MGVCSVVEDIADRVSAARQPLTPREGQWLNVIRGIGHFAQIKRLDLWEAACNKVCAHAPETITEELLEELQMLGQSNLYQAFQEQRTNEYYRRLIPFFAERGVCLPDCPDLSGW